MRTEPELLNERLERLALVLDEIMPNCALLVRDALELLKEQETGHWIYLENCSNSGVYCSECNTKVFDNYPIKKKFSYFCPHCGTRMEGEIERLVK